MGSYRWNRRRVSRAVAAACVAPWAIYSSRALAEQEILIGQTTAQSGPIGGLGTDALRSFQAYFDFVNRSGGVHGRRLRLLAFDDGYDATKALENARRLIDQEKVFAFAGVLGTPANMALLPLLKDAGVPSIGPFTGAEALRTPFNPLVFNTRASYADELERIVGHLEVRSLDRVSVVYQNNAFGNEGLASTEDAIKRRKRKLATSASLESNASDVARAVEKIVKDKPQAVILITAGASGPAFVKAYLPHAPGTQFFALSVMGTAGAIKALGTDGVGIVVTQVAPHPFASHLPLVAEYQKVLSAAGEKQFSYTSMESFITAKVLIEGLKRAGPALSRQRFTSGLESIGSVDWGGFPLHISSSDHRGSRYVDLTMISRGGGLIR